MDAHLQFFVLLALVYPASENSAFTTGASPLSIVAAYTIYRLMDTGQHLKRYVSIVLILMLGFNLLCTIKRNIISVHPIAYAFGLENRDQFLERAFDGIKNAQTHVNYRMFSCVNQHTEKSARILGIGTIAGYYVDRPLIWDREMFREKDVMRLVQELREAKINYILFNPTKGIKVGKVTKWNKPKQGEDIYAYFREKWGNHAIFSYEFREHFLKLVNSHNGQFLYKIRFDLK